MAGQSIIIIGGGAAGLMAAKELSAHNHVILLEADGRLGGRIHTVHGGGFTQPIEGGPEFIHGHLPLTLQLCKDANIKVEEVDGNMYNNRDGEWKERDTPIDGWAAFKKSMHTLKQDTTLKIFLDENYSGEKFIALREWVQRYAEGFDAADPAKVSVLSLYNEWTQDNDEQYRVKGGYCQLINYLENECKKNGAEIYTHSQVKQIAWAKNKVTVNTVDNKEYAGEKVVITVSAGILNGEVSGNVLSFTPGVPDYMQAIGQVGFGDVTKIVVEFKTAFWEKYKKSIGFILSNQFVPTWWTLLPDESPIITGWLGGPRSTALINEKDEVILKKSLQSLCNIFRMTMEELKLELVAAKVFNWPANPFTAGAYSYATPTTNKALPLLNTPVEDTIYFAGEALYDGPHPGTVEAALVSGKYVANKIITGK